MDTRTLDRLVTLPPTAARLPAFNLFLTGFLVLFLELACIRWFAANVMFLQFFTNVVLLACFLGTSCGCMAAGQPRDWLGYFPILALVTVLTGVAVMQVYEHWSVAIDIGHQASPQEVFFGAESRRPDLAQFAVPIDVIAAAFFVLIAFTFVGLGQVLGRAFDAYPDRVAGYTLNIGGSLVGIVAFSLISFLRAPPLIWFSIGCAVVAYLLNQSGKLTLSRGLLMVALLATIVLSGVYEERRSGTTTFWSPYYQIKYDPALKFISVDNIGHQQMLSYAAVGYPYSLIHLLRKAAGGAPFQDELIIGAGSGNDIDHALHQGVSRIDAVEIDPLIQRLGIRDHPDQPYSDPRVTRHLDDGRHFLRTTDRKYDLVVYALVDSLILHSSYANIRLESYLFTEEAFADIKRVLKPDGIFVSYNFFRQGWIVERVTAMAERVFGCKPLVISLPYREKLESSLGAGFNVIIAGCDGKLGEAFAAHKNFWLNRTPAANDVVDGFSVRPEAMPANERQGWQRIGLTTLTHDAARLPSASDDWPFLYLRDKLIPGFSIRLMIELGVIGMVLVFLFLPKGSGPLRVDRRMFFLGAAFLLLETKAVVQLALLFGSTWIVNSLVFFTALVLILLANLFVLKTPPASLLWYYAGLLILSAAAIAIPIDVYLSGGIVLRYVVPCLLALGPMFFAGVIFARTFRYSTNPALAFGSNVAGSVVGGLSEYFSMLLGFRLLLLLAIAFYLLSVWAPAEQKGRLPS